MNKQCIQALPPYIVSCLAHVFKKIKSKLDDVILFEDASLYVEYCRII